MTTPVQLSLLLWLRLSGAASPLSNCKIASIETHGVSVVDSDEPPWAQRLYKQASRSKPLLLKNLSTGWRASSLWSPVESFVKRFPDLRILVHEINPAHGLNVFDRRATPASYFELDGNESFNADDILFGFNDPEVFAAVSPDLAPFPRPLLRFRAEPGISLGRRGSGAGLHHHEQAWHAQVVGQKHFLLAPPAELSAAAKLAPGCAMLRGSAGDHVALPKKLCAVRLDVGDVLYFPDGWLHATCNSGETPTVAVVGRGDSSAWPPLLHAILEGDVDWVRSATIGQRDFEQHHAPAGETAVHIAARGATRSLDALIAKGADLTVPDVQGNAPLHVAAANGHVANCRSLLDRGAPVEAPGAAGLTALQSAAQAGHVAVLALLHERGAGLEGVGLGKGSRAIHGAVQRGHREVIAWLLSRGVDAGAKTREGRSPLHFAAELGHGESAALLLAARARVDAADSVQLRPLHLAASAGHAELLRALAAAGAEVSRAVPGWWPKAPTGLTALHLAALEGHLAAVRLLVKLGADVRAESSQRQTPLHLAQARRKQSVVDYLRKAMSDSVRRSASAGEL